jgi:RNA polymerase-binding transcription factor DksA
MSDRSDSPGERQPDRGLDLDSIERDLADVEVALARLDAGTYWTDEVTGDELPTDLLAANPTARRLA